MESPMQQQTASEARKRKGRLAVYMWRKVHPDAKNTRHFVGSLLTLITPHRDIISQHRKKERQAARYAAAEQASGQVANETSSPSL
jgi:hypothetical protein